VPTRTELLARNRKFQICFSIILAIVALGIIGPFVTRDPSEYAGGIYEPPSLRFLLGTDMAGRDVFAQLCVAIRDSLFVGVVAGSLALGIAVLMGGVLSYQKGLINEGANLVTNIFLVLPMLVILIVVAALFEGRNLLTVGILIALFSWPWMARNIRSQVLSLKERKFVDLARISGKGNFTIVVKEILPNMLAYVFLLFVMATGWAVVMESSISVIGLGPTRGFTLGKMLQLVIQWGALRRGIWWYFMPPGAFIVLFTGTLIVLTSVIDDVLNPKVRTE
jgi:peptide/nickel transport system permease protein